MKVLIITSIIPYPLSEGGKISQFAVSDRLRKYCELNYLLFPNTEREFEAVTKLRELWPDVSFTNIKTGFPLSRKMKMKRFAKNMIWKFSSFLSGLSVGRNAAGGYDPVIFAKSQLNSAFDFSGRMPIEVLEQLQKIVDDIQPDLIQVDFNLFLGHFLKKMGYPTVFVNHELRTDRVNSLIRLHNVVISLPIDIILEDLKAMEKRYLSFYDGIINFSDVSAGSVHELLGIEQEKLFVSPFPVLDELVIHKNYDQFNVAKLVFIGTDIHAPNQDAVFYYFQHIGAYVFEKTGLKLHVVGRWGKERIKKLRAEWMVFEGYVEDLTMALNDAIMVVPIQFGGGIRTKILYAMGQYVPIVSTSIGAEGIDSENKILIKDTKEEFAEAILSLFSDKNYAYSLAANAFNEIKERYCQDVVAKNRFEIFSKVLHSYQR